MSFARAIVVFTLGSIFCGLSSTLPQFVAARIFQGCGAAMMTPVGRLTLFRSVERSQIVRAMAYLTIPALIGPMLGPPLGGFISTYLHWRWNFWINVPVGIVGVILSSLYIPDIRDENVAAFDTRGFLLSGLGLSSLIFGLTVLGRGFIDWELNFALVAAGLVLVGLYVRHALDCRQSDSRTAPAGNQNLFGEPRRGLPVPDRRRRDAFPVAVAASARIRHDALPIRLDDLRGHCGRAGHEGDGRRRR